MTDRPRSKALILTSNAVRHRYFIDRVASMFDVVGAMSEPKKNYFDEARDQSSVVEKHFKNLVAAEKMFFPEAASTITPVVIDDLNVPEAVEKAIRMKPDVICLFGTSILKTPWIDAFPERIINLHLGLSPYYRGAGTLFWPFHDGNLAGLGTTIHLAIAKVDAGAILKRIKPRFELGDGYYSVTTRLIRDSIDVFPSVVREYLDGKIVPFAQESYQNARVMKKADFNEDALIKAFDFIGTGLTKERIAIINASDTCPC